MFLFNTKSKQQKKSAELYQKAICLFQSGKLDEAIFTFGVSIEADPNPSSFKMLGHCYTRQGAFQKAADAYNDGRKLVQRELPLPFMPNSVPEDVIEFFCHEALAYLRGAEWEFARLRAHAALAHIKFGKASRYATYGDIESWLRLIRMVAATQESFNFPTAHADALWLSENSIVKGYSSIYAPILSESSTASRLAEVVLDEWMRYDLPRRSLGIIFDDKAST